VRKQAEAIKAIIDLPAITAVEKLSLNLEDPKV